MKRERNSRSVHFAENDRSRREESPSSRRSRRRSVEVKCRVEKPRRRSATEPSSRSRTPLSIKEAAMRSLDGVADLPSSKRERRVSVTPEVKQMARGFLRGTTEAECKYSCPKGKCEKKASPKCSKQRKNACRDCSPPPSEEAIRSAVRDAYATPYVRGKADTSPPPSEEERRHALEDAEKTPFPPSSSVLGRHSSSSGRPHVNFAEGATGSTRRSSHRRSSTKAYEGEGLLYQRNECRCSSSSSRRDPDDRVSVTFTRQELITLLDSMKKSTHKITVVLKSDRVTNVVGADKTRNCHC